MEATLETAIDILRQIAQTYLTDDMGHLESPRSTVEWRVIEFLEKAGEVEKDDLTDHLGNIVSRKHRLKKPDPSQIKRCPRKLADHPDDPEDLAWRTMAACEQFTRYGTAVYNAQLLSVLEHLTDLNDDLYNGRDKSLRETIVQIKAELDTLGETDRGF